MWRAGLCGERACPRWGAQRPLKPATEDCLGQHSATYWGCCAAQRGQARLPRFIGLRPGAWQILQVTPRTNRLSVTNQLMWRAGLPALGREAPPETRNRGLPGTTQCDVLGLLRSPTRASPLATGYRGCGLEPGKYCRSPRANRLSVTNRLMWRAGLCGERACPRWGAKRPLKPTTEDCLAQHSATYWGCCAAQRGQARSPHKPARHGVLGCP